MKTLTLSLKKKWFNLIKRGIKKEEYREIKPRYLSMFCEQLDVHEPNEYNEFSIGFHLQRNQYDKLVFTLGYPSKQEKKRWMTFSNPKIRIDKGKTEWGAEKDKLYFVITWEEK